MRSSFRILALLPMVVVCVVILPSQARAWDNGADGGNGFGTHDWILREAARQAAQKGVRWIDLRTALAATDDPDTQFRDFQDHLLDFWGDTGGSADSKVEYYFNQAMTLRKTGDIAGASRAVGHLSHYYADICNPLHTDDALAREERMHAAYERAVNSRTDSPREHAEWLAPDGHQPVLSVAAKTRAAARSAHRSYRPLVFNHDLYGFNSIVRTITKASLNRAVNGISDILITLTRGVSVRSYGAKGNGANDDTAAIKAALSAVAAKGGGTVFVPAGDYRVSSLNIPAGVNVVGEGMNRSWLHGAVKPSSTLTLSDLKLGTPSRQFRFTNGTHDALLLRCRIVGGPTAIAFIGNVVRDVTFRKCVIDPNRASVGNAVALLEHGDSSGHYEDIVWEDCHFLGSTRMTVEILHRATSSTGKGYRNISFLRCVFEPSDSQVISYDAVPVGTLGIVSGYSRVEGCVIKGAGANPSMSWPHGLEINGPRGMVVKDNTFYACRGSALNFHGSQGDDARPLGWVTVTGNTFDMTRGATPHSPVAVVNAKGGGTVWRDNSFIVNTGAQVFLLWGGNNLIEDNRVTDTRATSNSVLFDLDGAPDNTIRGNTLRGQGARVSVRAGSSGNVFAGNRFMTGQTRTQVFRIASGVSVSLVDNTFE